MEDVVVIVEIILVGAVGHGRGGVGSKRFSKPVEPHRLSGLYILKNTKEESLITKNIASGK